MVVHEAVKEIGGEEPPSDPLQSSQHLNPSSPSDTLPSDAERQRSHVSKRVSALMDQLQSNIFVASQRLNDLTGYSGIEALKRSIEAQEAFVQQARSAVRAAKEAYSSAIAQRSASQREVNELLQRKHAWSSQDLERFTTLYRSDHANEQAEMKAGETLAAAERTAEEAAAKLSKNILARYHEEQIWSDKIRRMSTWGTWGLMGMNILLFVVFQIAVEPWRRKRLVNGFEEKVREAMTERNEKNDPVMNDTVTTSSDQTPLFSNTNDSEIQPETSMTETSGTSTDDSMSNPLDDDDHHLPEAQNPSAQIPILGLEEDIPHSSPSSSTLERYTHPVVAGLFSAKEVTLRKFELTTLVLEGFAAGATLCAIVCK
ncbi:MAG: Transcription initiation factor IIA small chain (TFIIA 13.5 kDa subunit) [Watsoniomyces obsoletus]|nr:MAG: Transcription initiation factor IIA small chain (TFIIA 13.5 kDa subunit) [Watsoniomyces obsoletus]